jgi:hypothetical protein
MQVHTKRVIYPPPAYVTRHKLNCHYCMHYIYDIGSIPWAFYNGPEVLAQMAALVPGGLNIQPVPTIETRMITFYSQATGRLTHDSMDFFMRF